MRVDSRAAAACGSLFGLGLAIPLARRISGAAAPDQSPGYARAHGFSAHADLERFLVFAILSIAGAWLVRAAHERIGRGTGTLARRLADPAPWFGLVAAPLVALLGSGVFPVVASAALVFISIAALAPLVRSGGSARGVVLPAVLAQALIAWAFLARPLARFDLPLLPLLIAVFAFFALTAAIASSSHLERGVEIFSGSVLLLPVALWRNRPESVEVAAALFAVASPLVLSGLRRLPFEMIVAKTLKRTLPAMLASSFVILAAAACLRLPPIANLFEDGHALLPASEYLAGRLPYRDIAPEHGLISDGLLQASELRLLGMDYSGISRGDRLVGAFFWPLIFAMATAASGKVEIGFWATALSFLLFPQYLFLRVMASFGVLAAASFARRRPTVRAWVLTGALIPFAVLWGVEFALYGALASLAAIVVSRGRRGRNLIAFTAGASAMSAVIGVAFAALGIAKDFIHITFLYLPKLAPAYMLGFPKLPDSIGERPFPDSLAALGDPGAFYFWCLLLALVAVAVTAANIEAISEKGRALVPFLVWFLSATLSVIERHHIGYPMFIVPVAIVLGARWVAGEGESVLRRGAAALLLVWAVVVGGLVGLLRGVAIGLQNTTLSSAYVLPTSPKRVDGAAFRIEDAKAVAAVSEFIGSRLAPGDTWLDFTSTSSLYFYFDRRCPIRYYEVASYETPEAQNEVIRAIDRNARVRAVLVHLGAGAAGGEAIDGVPNRERAPLVWSYVEAHFHPAFTTPEVVFWERNPPGPAPVSGNAPAN